jgi:Family of unknown function (DUF6491)
MRKAALLLVSLMMTAAATAAPLRSPLLASGASEPPVSRLPVLRAPTDAPPGQSPGDASGEAASSLVPSPAAQPKRKAATCVNTRMIQQAIVIDDRTIRMLMGRRRALDLKLRGTCFGLRFDESFYYQPGPTGQLCERFDTIVTRSGHRCLIDAIVPVELRPERK